MNSADIFSCAKQTRPFQAAAVEHLTFPSNFLHARASACKFVIARILRTRSRRQRRVCQSTLVCVWRRKRMQAAAARIVQGRWRRCEDKMPFTTSREFQTRRGMLKILEQYSKHLFEQPWSAHRTILDSAINTSSLTRYLAVLKIAAASLLKVDLHSHISAKPLKEALKAKSTTIKHFLNFDANFTNHFFITHLF